MRLGLGHRGARRVGGNAIASSHRAVVYVPGDPCVRDQLLDAFPGQRPALTVVEPRGPQCRVGLPQFDPKEQAIERPGLDRRHQMQMGRHPRQGQADDQARGRPC